METEGREKKRQTVGKKRRGEEKGDKRKPLACCKSHHLLPTCIVHMTAISSTYGEQELYLDLLIPFGFLVLAPAFQDRRADLSCHKTSSLSLRSASAGR